MYSGGDAPRFTFVGTIFFRSDHLLQAHVVHQPLDGLVIDALAEPPDTDGHASIAEAPLVPLEDRLDLG